MKLLPLERFTNPKPTHSAKGAPGQKGKKGPQQKGGSFKPSMGGNKFRSGPNNGAGKPGFQRGGQGRPQFNKGFGKNTGGGGGNFASKSKFQHPKGAGNFKGANNNK